MKATIRERGVILYTKDREDLVREAMEALAKKNAQKLSDEEAAGLDALFDRWEPGRTYTAGTRVADGQGNLYRVIQDHVGGKDRPVSCCRSLYLPLGADADGTGGKKAGA